MKFRHINIENVRQLIPTWAGNYMQIARATDQILSQYTPARHADPFAIVKFSVRLDVDRGIAQIHEPDNDPNFMGAFIVESSNWKIDMQINYVLKGGIPVSGGHCVYSHALMTDVPIGYIGLTKRPWFVRFAEHEAAARSGSCFLFHEALRRHPSVRRIHRLFVAGVGLEAALQTEEKLVAACSLYPLGLNMIPGGRAGLRYLSSLSVKLKSTEFAPEEISREMQRPSTEGRPNPLAAARWESDPDYAARVICGHSGRLTVEQVQMIRAMHIAQRTPDEIAVLSGAKNKMQVRKVLSSQTYSRVR